MPDAEKCVSIHNQLNMESICLKSLFAEIAAKKQKCDFPIE
jgi:hypothetical protein